MLVNISVNIPYMDCTGWQLWSLFVNIFGLPWANSPSSSLTEGSCFLRWTNTSLGPPTQWATWSRSQKMANVVKSLQVDTKLPKHFQVNDFSEHLKAVNQKTWATMNRLCSHATRAWIIRWHKSQVVEVFLTQKWSDKWNHLYMFFCFLHVVFCFLIHTGIVFFLKYASLCVFLSGFVDDHCLIVFCVGHILTLGWNIIGTILAVRHNLSYSGQQSQKGAHKQVIQKRFQCGEQQVTWKKKVKTHHST